MKTYKANCNTKNSVHNIYIHILYRIYIHIFI